MNSFVILITLIGVTSLTSAQTVTTATTTENPSKAGSAVTNTTIADNSTVIEFFGPIEEKSTTVDENVLQKPNISSMEKERSKRYRIRNYDPLLSNAQSPNPFLSGAQGARGGRRPGGGVDPQIAALLRNPRIRALAEQNPQMAQQILRNPQLLRNPVIANAIRSQLGEGGGGGGGGLLGLLPGGLGAALNPLGIGLGGGQQGNGNQGLGGYGNQGRSQNNNNNNNGGVFGAPRGLDNRRQGNRNRPNEENIGGGYYGNNRNYGNNNNRNNNQNNNNNNEDNSGATDEGNNEEGQDYDNSGQEGGDEEGQEGQGEEGGEGQEAQDPSQDPANDPDIQQLQNLGGGAGDNFPESLFPPGLLSKEDLNEIRKQQEKQQRDQAEKERQQQLQQGGGIGEQGGGGDGQDYDYNNPEEGNGEEGAEGGEETPEEGAEEGAQEGGDENTTAYEEPVTTVQPIPVTPPVYRANPKPNLKYRPEFGGVRQGSVQNTGVEYDDAIDVNTPTTTPHSINSAIGGRGRGKNGAIPPVIPVPAVGYRGQQPVQPYVNPQQGIYPQQPLGGQVYGQQPQYGQQPLPYYPQYPPQYIPQQQNQQYIPQQYPQQYVPQQQYVGQQQGQYPQQGLYQPTPIQQGYLPQQPVYNQYPQNVNARGRKQGRRPNQLQRGGVDPNIANHNLNTIPHDDSEDYDNNQSASPNPGFNRPNGRPFQQQPRIFSSSAQNTESSVAFNTTEPSAVSNKYNINTNVTFDDIPETTHRLF